MLPISKKYSFGHADRSLPTVQDDGSFCATNPPGGREVSPEMESVPNVSVPGTDLNADGEPVVVLSMADPPLLCCRLSICFPAKSQPDLCFPSIPTYKLGRGLPDTSANQFYMPRLREIALLLI